MHLKWSPTQIGELFVDEIDYLGILYWFDAIARHNEKLKAK